MALVDSPPADLPDAPDNEVTGARSLTAVLLALIAVAVVAAAVAVGHMWGSGSGSSSTPASDSVDAGFARDMSTHHQQAITMAGYTRDNTASAEIRQLAFDIETGQLFQVGQMQGWLDNWGLSRASNQPVAWMGEHGHLAANGLMPGFATPEEMDRLRSSHGHELDVLFLQLMIRHHQGGIPMAQYAAEHAREPYVRTLAQAMYTAQSGEVVQMERLLRSLGGVPLPAPDR